jgi:uncharacterized protein YjiS (DUF1127 family)
MEGYLPFRGFWDAYFYERPARATWIRGVFARYLDIVSPRRPMTIASTPFGQAIRQSELPCRFQRWVQRSASIVGSSQSSSYRNGVGKMQQVEAVQGNTGHSFLASLTELAFRAYEAVSDRNTRRASVRHLRSLSDHHLKDLGIDRSEILSVVYNDAPDRTRVSSSGS